MKKAMGKIFRSQTSAQTGLVRILGSWYDYKVVSGMPEVGVLLEVVDFTSRELLVVVTYEKDESDVNYVGSI